MTVRSSSFISSRTLSSRAHTQHGLLGKFDLARSLKLTIFVRIEHSNTLPFTATRNLGCVCVSRARARVVAH